MPNQNNISQAITHSACRFRLFEKNKPIVHAYRISTTIVREGLSTPHILRCCFGLSGHTNSIGWKSIWSPTCGKNKGRYISNHCFWLNINGKKHPTERFAPQMWCHFYFEGQGKTVEKASKRWKFSVRQKGAKKDWPEEILNIFCLLPFTPRKQNSNKPEKHLTMLLKLALKWPSINWFLLV